MHTSTSEIVAKPRRMKKRLMTSRTPKPVRKDVRCGQQCARKGHHQPKRWFWTRNQFHSSPVCRKGQEHDQGDPPKPSVSPPAAFVVIHRLYHASPRRGVDVSKPHYLRLIAAF